MPCELNLPMIDATFEFLNPLSNVSKLSNKAKDEIFQKQQNISNQEIADRLSQSYQAFQDLDRLIELAHKNHAYVGMLILSRQLQQSSGSLNAAVLLKNFLNVFDLAARCDFERDYGSLKFICSIPFAGMCTFTAILLPLLLLTPVALPWLFLGISALPLLLIYAFEAPMSMSRWYQEMAILETALSILILSGGLLSVLATWSMLPLLTSALMIASIVICGAGLLLHSRVLNEKHENLSNSQSMYLSATTRSFIETMFKTEDASCIINQLHAIKL